MNPQQIPPPRAPPIPSAAPPGAAEGARGEDTLQAEGPLGSGRRRPLHRRLSGSLVYPPLSPLLGSPGEPLARTARPFSPPGSVPASRESARGGGGAGLLRQGVGTGRTRPGRHSNRHFSITERSNGASVGRYRGTNWPIGAKQSAKSRLLAQAPPHWAEKGAPMRRYSPSREPSSSRPTPGAGPAAQMRPSVPLSGGGA